MARLTTLLFTAPFAGSLASATPTSPDEAASNLAARQFGFACKPVIVIFARGTSEVSPIGTIVGPQFRAALAARLGAGNVDFQGVQYDALVSGFLAGGSPVGSSRMAQMVRQTAASCPGSRIIMSGYSQGGQLVHNAGARLDYATAASVAGAVIFGDPDNPQPVANGPNLKVFCATGDLICQGKPIILPPQLSYAANPGEAAEFVAASVGF